MGVADYKELRVYQLAFAAAMRIHELSDDYDHICRQLSRMMDCAATWCGTTSRIREELGEYFAAASRSPLSSPRSP